MPRLTKSQIVTCQSCGRVCIRTGPAQRYCRTCSDARGAERQRKWARRHPPSPEAIQHREARLRLRRQNQGSLINREEASTISWPARLPEPNLTQLVRVSVVFDPKFSKNSMWSMASGGSHLFQRSAVKALRAHLAETIRLASKSVRWFQRKTYLDILVQKPNHRGDAINMLDTIADAVKDAIGVDDRWFSVRRLEWQIVKVAPRLFVGVGQEGEGDQLACSFCGRLLGLDAFWKDRNAKMGVQRECKDCSRVAYSRSEKRIARALRTSTMASVMDQKMP